MGSDTRAPEQVSAERRPTKKKKPELADALAPMLALLFTIPAMGGYGEHWTLREDEARTLAENFQACAATLPPGKVTQAQKFLEKIVPWGVLAWTSYTITAPRIAATHQLMEERARAVQTQRHHPGHVAPAGPAAASPDNAGNGAAPAAGSAHVAELFGERQQ